MTVSDVIQKQKSVALIVLVVMVIILIFQNTDEIETRVFFWHLTMPAAMLLGATFAFGLGVGYLVCSRQNRRSGRSLDE